MDCSNLNVQYYYTGSLFSLLYLFLINLQHFSNFLITASYNIVEISFLRIYTLRIFVADDTLSLTVKKKN